MCIQISSLLFTLIPIIFGFANDRLESEYAFTHGEALQYKLNYGWLSIGRGSFKIAQQSEEYLREDCYRVTASGNTTGLLRWLAPVEDEWGALIRTQDLIPLHTYRNLREGRYRLKEEVYIDPLAGSIKVESVKPHRKEPQRPTRNYTFDQNSQVFDLLSGLLVIRNYDFEQYNPGDTLALNAFLEDSFYHFQIIYAGKEQLKTAFGRTPALKLIPLMPKNKVFDGKQSLEAWFSADENKLPLKVSARMFVGKVSAELISYQNIKYSLVSEQ